MRPRLRAAAIAIALLAACAPPTSPSPPPSPVVAIAPATPARSAEPAAPEVEEPTLPPDEARTLAEALVAARDKAEEEGSEAKAAWLARAAEHDPAVRRALAGMGAACLGSSDDRPPACDPGADEAPLFLRLVEIAGEVADARAPGGATARLLVRLSTRGAWRAGMAIEHVLERRLLGAIGPCAPPTEDEIAAARRSLADFALVERRGAGLEARWPTPAELDTMALFTAALADSGPEVGTQREDAAAKPLPADHPDHARRAALRADERGALRAGDLERHTRAAEAYLATLGWPGPLRLAEEGDERWGGAGASYLLRELARSAELLGRYDLAERAWRRARPGGGMCGTSTDSYRTDQIQGAIRAGEQGRGCRAVVAERLWGVPIDLRHAYGIDRLAAAGFDVPRLYEAALLTLGRDDADELDRALGSLTERAAEARGRLAERGPEAWATRLRAVRGAAEAGGGAAVDRLLGIADAADEATRVEALGALGDLARDRGWDPCVPTKYMRGFGYGSRMHERRVRSVMGRCATRIDAKTIDRVVDRLAQLARDPRVRVRVAVAEALGHLGAPRGRPTLAALARDATTTGGQTCSGTPMKCAPTRPVAEAARRALDDLAKADAMRAEQRRAPRRRP